MFLFYVSKKKPCIFWYIYFSKSVLGEHCHLLPSFHCRSFVSQCSNRQLYDKKISLFFFFFFLFFHANSWKKLKIITFSGNQTFKFAAIHTYKNCLKTEIHSMAKLIFESKTLNTFFPPSKNIWWVPHGIFY